MAVLGSCPLVTVTFEQKMAKCDRRASVTEKGDGLLLTPGKCSLFPLAKYSCQHFQHFPGARALPVCQHFSRASTFLQLVPALFWCQHFSGARALLVSAFFW
jgi:hypothetical protein